jgi:hypothetical protein
MSRTVLVVLVLIVGTPVALFVILAISTSRAVERAAQREWADGRTIAMVAREFPSHEASAAAGKLKELGTAIGIPFETNGERQQLVGLEEYVDAQHRRAERIIDPPQEDLAGLIGEQKAQLDGVRDLLLSGDEVVWRVDLLSGFEPPAPDTRSYVELTRLLTARAYMLARDGDPAAWEELHAVWQLARHLLARPESASQWVAVAIARGVNAASWKMPLPAPAWIDELRETDFEGPRFRAARADAFLMLTHGESPFPPVRPIGRYLVVRSIEASRLAMRDLAHVTECGTDSYALVARHFKGAAVLVPPVTVYAGAMSWQRVFLFRAEREAAANALRVAAGESIVPRSVCRDGAWSLADGRLTFGGDLRKYEKELVMPLSLAVGATR